MYDFSEKILTILHAVCLYVLEINSGVISFSHNSSLVAAWDTLDMYWKDLSCVTLLLELQLSSSPSNELLYI